MKARLVAKGFQGPDLKAGLVDTSGCASLRSSHPQVVSLRAIRQWKVWSLDIKNAFLLADGFARGVFLHAPTEWGPPCKKRVKAPAVGLHDSPVAFHRSLKRHILNSDLSLKNAGLRCQAATFGPGLFSVFRDQGQVVSAFTRHIDDISGCGEPDVLPKIRGFSE